VSDQTIAFIILVTVIFGITVEPLHKYLCRTFKIYNTINIFFFGMALISCIALGICIDKTTIIFRSTIYSFKNIRTRSSLFLGCGI